MKLTTAQKAALEKIEKYPNSKYAALGIRYDTYCRLMRDGLITVTGPLTLTDKGSKELEANR